MGWSYEITKAKNGYIVTNVSDDDYEDEGILVIEEDGQDEDKKLKSMRDMLQEIKELFGCHYSKHDKKNIVISIEETAEDETGEESENDG